MTYMIEIRPVEKPGADRPTPQQIAGVLAALLPDGSKITVAIRP